jgi:hypothetical protein
MQRCPPTGSKTAGAADQSSRCLTPVPYNDVVSNTDAVSHTGALQTCGYPCLTPVPYNDVVSNTDAVSHTGACYSHLVINTGALQRRGLQHHRAPRSNAKMEASGE